MTDPIEPIDPSVFTRGDVLLPGNGYAFCRAFVPDDAAAAAILGVSDAQFAELVRVGRVTRSPQGFDLTQLRNTSLTR